MLKTIEPMIAHQSAERLRSGGKPPTVKCSPNASDSAATMSSRMPFTMRPNSPIVRIVSGNVMIFSAGRMKAFTRPKMTATPMTPRTVASGPKLSWVTICVVIHSATALTSIRMTIPVIDPSLQVGPRPRASPLDDGSRSHRDGTDAPAPLDSLG